MKTIAELRDSRAKLWSAMESFLDTHANDKGVLSAEDDATYNKIKLVKDNKKTGKRDVYIFQDSKNMTLWGILQDYEVVDEDMNEAQIKKRGGQMLELYNRPKRSFSVSAIADLSVRAGRALYIGIGAVGVKSFFIVEEATHDLLKETMSLKLKVV